MTKIPKEFRSYFWDADFDELTLEKYPRFIIERILNFGDLNSIKWLLSCTDMNFIRTVIHKSRNLNTKTRNYWQIVMADTGNLFPEIK